MKTRIKPFSYMQARERRLFNSICGDFPVDFFTSSDRCLLAQFVFAHFSAVDAEIRMRENGPTVTNEKGITVANPDARVARDNTMIMSNLSTKLRLNPQTRKLPQNMQPALQKARDNKSYNPTGDRDAWRHQQRDDEKSH